MSTFKSSKIIGLWSGHDASFCVLKNGVPEIHTELERHLRQKEPAGDSIEMFYKHYGDETDVIGLATCHKDSGIKAHAASWEKISRLGVPLYVCGHHQAHAANAFYSSNFNDATVITIDGGGIEDERGFTTGVTMWKGTGTKIEPTKYVPLEKMNVGGVWSRVTRCIFRYESGWPQGNQCGTTMALAALGKDPQRYLNDFRSFFRENLSLATARAPGHVVGRSVKDPTEQRHPFLGKWRDVANVDEQAKYDMALALQIATEEILLGLIKEALELNPGSKHLCVSGGVALNSVAMGKIMSWFPQLEGVYIPPVPYDAGLTIGAAQYAWHHVLGNFRVFWQDNAKPYLGKTYSESEIDSTIEPYVKNRQIVPGHGSDEAVIDLLAEGKIVSVFNGRAESGRRALGNRSILADPRNPDMKNIVNEKVKHRQWFRPFAPSVIREAVKDIFTTDQDSPYMGFVLQFKPELKEKLPAIVHFDGSARLQTVTSSDNPWYHSFLKKWGQKSGYPIILNTSFNDREPICETPHDAIKCFLGTNIDYLYFPEFGILLTKSDS